MPCVIVPSPEAPARAVSLSRCTLRSLRRSPPLLIHYCPWRLDFPLPCGLKSKASGKMCRKHSVVRGRTTGRLRRCPHCSSEAEERLKHCWGPQDFTLCQPAQVTHKLCILPSTAILTQRRRFVLRRREMGGLFLSEKSEESSPRSCSVLPTLSTG